MAQNSLFQLKDVKNNTSRSGFDLSKRRLFSGKVGEILPVWWQPMMPGDKAKINLRSFTRTQPVNSSAFTRVREYYDFFYVPYRLLWRNANTSFTMLNNNNVVALSPTSSLNANDTVPYVNTDFIEDYLGELEDTDPNGNNAKTNSLGFERKPLTEKLLNMLGYGYSDSNHSRISNKNLQLFPLLAYNKFFYDFFRRQQWENNKPEHYNVDYMGQSTNFENYVQNLSQFADKENLFDLKYANYGLDLFFGLIPNSQYGDESVIDVSFDGSINVPAQSLKVNYNNTVVDSSTSRAVQSNATSPSLEGSSGIMYPFTSATQGSRLTTDPNLTNSNNLSLSTQNLISQFSILQLRHKSALQKWREISMSGNTDYREQIEKHFNVKLPHTLSNLSTYVGGVQGNLSIHEVVNNNLTEADSEAFIFGKGVGQVSGDTMSFTAKEHGIIMCVWHARPIIDFALSGVSRNITSVEISDFAVPEFDRLGYEPVSLDEFFNTDEMNFAQGVSRSLVGYAPRYYNYKTDVDDVQGIFRTTLPNWVAQYDEKFVESYLNGESFANVFKINPHILDDIFNFDADSTVDTDQFLIECNIGCHFVRNLDFNGLPY